MGSTFSGPTGTDWDTLMTFSSSSSAAARLNLAGFPMKVSIGGAGLFQSFWEHGDKNVSVGELMAWLSFMTCLLFTAAGVADPSELGIGVGGWFIELESLAVRRGFLPLPFPLFNKYFGRLIFFISFADIFGASMVGVGTGTGIDARVVRIKTRMKWSRSFKGTNATRSSLITGFTQESQLYPSEFFIDSSDPLSVRELFGEPFNIAVNNSSRTDKGSLESMKNSDG